MTGVDRNTDTGLDFMNATALAIQESGGHRTSGALGLSWEASEAAKASCDVRSNRGDSASVVPDMADGDQGLRSHVNVLETEDDSASTSVCGRDSSFLEFSGQPLEKRLPVDDASSAQHVIPTDTVNHSERREVYAACLSLEARQVTWKAGYEDGLSTRSLDQISRSNGYTEVDSVDLMVGHGTQGQLSREVPRGSLEVDLSGARSTEVMSGFPSLDQLGRVYVRTSESVHTVAVHSKDTSVGQSDCCGRVSEAEEIQRPVQAGKSSTELRMGDSFFPKGSSDVLGTLDPACSTDSGFDLKPIPVGFSPP